MLVVFFFKWLNLDRFREKYKSVWILFMRSSLLSFRCECTFFTNLSDLAALSAESTLFFVVLRTAVSFASLSFMLTTADCFWTWVDVALSAELMLFFVVLKTAVSFAMLSFMSMTADCFWIWIESIQFCSMKFKVLVNLYWYTWSIELSIVISWLINNVLISFLQVVTLLIFLLSLTSMNLVCSWWEAEIDEVLSVSSTLIISSLFTYMCFWSIRVWCSASYIKASSMIKLIWDIT